MSGHPCSIMNALRLSLAVLVLSAGAPAYAQTGQSDRPYRGLFAGGLDASEQALTLQGALGAGYDDHLLDRDAVRPSQGEGGHYENASVGLSYTLTAERFGFSASGNTFVRHYEAEADMLTSDSFGYGAHLQLTRKTRISGSGNVLYSPTYVLGVFPLLPGGELEGALPTDQQFETTRHSYVEATNSVTLDHQLTRRSAVSVSVSHDIRDLASGGNKQVANSAGARYSRRVNRWFGLGFGYGQTVAHYPADAAHTRFVYRTLDVGLDFDRPISLTRRTKLAFNTGSAGTNDGGQTRYHFTGNVSLSHEIGRSWSAAVAYKRDVGFVAAFRQPALSDGVSVGLGGLLTRRVRLQLSGGVAIGDVGLSGPRNHYKSYFAGSSIGIALSRYLSFDLSYACYRYTFSSQDLLVPGTPTAATRQDIRASLSFWSPLMHRGRKPSAAR